MSGDGILQFLNTSGLVLRRAVPQHDDELVAGEPGAQIVLAYRRLQDRSDRAQRAVTRLVSIRVVDFLQAIEVEHDDADRGPGARRVRETGFELPIERATVRQPGQRIGM